MNQNSSGEFSSQEQSRDSEISLLDIFIFFKKSYKLIALISLLGVAASSIYLFITPKQYQATVQIQMAQISTANNKIYPLGINIEEPDLLIARFSSPTTYTTEVSKACGLGSEKVALAVLSNSVKLSIAKGKANVVDLKIISTSPENTVVCAQAVFDLIKVTQAQIVKPYIDEAKATILDAQERLVKSKDLIAKADKAESAMGAVYLSTRDEIRFLLDEIAALTKGIAYNENMATRLVAPIYASDDPIAPKKRNVLLMGLFGGLFMGMLIAFGRQLIPNIKAQLENTTASR